MKERVEADQRAGENGLSFIETSALEATNVDLAFQNILSCTAPIYPHPSTNLTDLLRSHLRDRVIQEPRRRRGRRQEVRPEGRQQHLAQPGEGEGE
jgi:hypothetical protein